MFKLNISQRNEISILKKTLMNLKIVWKMGSEFIACPRTQSQKKSFSKTFQAFVEMSRVTANMLPLDSWAN
jgi:hypothetical protein